jgi:hypothetical protein
MKDKIVKITPEYLTNIFSSKIFTDALKKCADISYSKHIETSFSINQDFSNPNFALERIIKGDYGKIDSSSKDIYDKEADHFKNYPLIDLHFHYPCYDKETIVPSEMDLQAFLSTSSWELFDCQNEVSEYATRVIFAIASIYAEKNIEALLFQTKNDKLTQSFMEGVSLKLEDLGETKNRNKEVIKILKENCLNAGIISYKRTKEGYKLANPDVLKKFASSPKFIRKIDYEKDFEEMKNTDTDNQPI